MRRLPANRSEDSRTEKSWAALLAGYERVSTLNHEEDSRLFKLVGAYIAGVVGIASWLVPHLRQDGGAIPSFILSVGSVANSYYVIFYSYHSVHLALSANYLKALAGAADRHVGAGSDHLRWEEYSSSGGGDWTRSTLLALKTTWRFVPLVLAGLLAYFAHKTAKGPIECYVSLGAAFFAVAGLIAAILSLFSVTRSNVAQTRDFKERKRREEKGPASINGRDA